MIIVNNPQISTPLLDDKRDLKPKLEPQSKNIFEPKTLKEAPSEIQTKLENLVNKLLDGIKASGDSKAILQAKSSLVAPNLAKDLNELVKSLETQPQLSSLKDKLVEFLKPITQIKDANLAQSIKNSGIMLEANLRQSLDPKELPTSIKELLGDMKNVSSPKLANELLKLAQDDGSDAKQSFAKLGEILKNTKLASLETLNNSNLKPLFETLGKLENISKFLDKVSFQNQVSPNNAKTSLNTIQNTINTALSQINEIEIPQNSATTKSLQNLSNEIKDSLNAIKKDLNLAKNPVQNQPNLDRVKEEGVKSQVSPQENAEPKIQNLPQNPNLMSENFKALINSDMSLQDKISLVVRKLNQLTSLMDKQGFEAKEALNDTKHLLKASAKAQNDLPQISQKDSSAIAKTISQDMKSVLLNLKESTQNQPNLNHINSQVSRMITQIEMHQLVSYAQNSMQTYLPFVWDGLERSSMAFKQGKKNKFYAKIDLSFVKFGEISVLLGLTNKKYLDISIVTSNESFKKLVLDSAKELKSAISGINLILSNFSLKSAQKGGIYDEFDKLDVGFDVKA